MNRIEHLLTTTGEEANEVAQRVSKALRFGLNEVQPDQPLTNAERLVDEFHDLYAMLDWLQREGALPSRIDIKPDHVRMREKREKVERFMAISREQGVLS
jgi:hypothetical protein